MQETGLVEEPHGDDDEVAAEMTVSDQVFQPGAP